MEINKSISKIQRQMEWSEGDVLREVIAFIRESYGDKGMDLLTLLTAYIERAAGQEIIRRAEAGFMSIQIEDCATEHYRMFIFETDWEGVCKVVDIVEAGHLSVIKDWFGNWSGQTITHVHGMQTPPTGNVFDAACLFIHRNQRS